MRSTRRSSRSWCAPPAIPAIAGRTRRRLGESPTRPITPTHASSPSLQTAGTNVRIVWPTPDFPSETASTLLLVRLQNATLNGLQVKVDGNAVSGGTSQTSANTIDVRYHVSLPPGSHSLSVSAVSSL